jgi:hypothetical protein
MRTKFVGWALAHRDNIAEQSLTPPMSRQYDHSMPHGLSQTRILFAILLIILLFSVIWLMKPRHRHPPGIKQRAQFHSIDAAIELFRAHFDVYPPSDALDENGRPYCGTMKLCEAMMGRDLMGFHPDSVFNSDGMDSRGNILYPKSNAVSGEAYHDSLKVRKGPYLPLENANAYRLADIYGEGKTGSFDPNDYVLCGTFEDIKIPGKRKKVGMPILYYKADTSKTAHDVNDPDNPENIYDYRDNQALLALGVPGKARQKHPLFEDPKIFYEMTRNTRVAGPSVPNRADTYILVSAGYDGLYGTEDDIANFDFRWRPK